ncbi:hypothetical protein SEA_CHARGERPOWER_49 [Mycobacterium phage Chargerpower]|nr:hypothetical protein SEA_CHARGERPOWER_49 [Mycobacterium phage Chargerpower]
MKGSNLSYEDPWASAPADAPAEEAQAAPVEQQAPVATVTTATAAAVDSVSVQHSTDGVSATFKFAGAYSDPWVVVKGSDPGDVLGKVNTSTFKELMDTVQKIAGVYAGAAKAAIGGQAAAAPAQQSRAPQAAQEAPGGEKRFCSHGEMVFKSGVAKGSGKPYQLFSCTAPRDQQCKAQFLK